MLTALEIKNAKPGMHADGNGLYLRVQDSLTKGWIYRFQLNGRRREMGLGLLKNVPAPDARTEAARVAKLVRDGVDPIEQRRQTKICAAEHRATPAFSVVAADYIESHRAGWKSAKHGQQWENTLAQYAFPFIGNKPVDAITTEDVLRVLKPIWASKTETASRLRSRIELILSYAKAKGLRQESNPAIWRGHIDALLPPPQKLKAKTSRHHPALPYQRMTEFMKALKKVEGMSARAVELAILTACRSQEARFATWAEFDLERKLWTVPSNHMKAGKEHVVPLSDSVVAMLRELPKIVDGHIVFPGTKGQSLSDMSLTAVLRRMSWKDHNGATITTHGFRSTFRDWAGETTSHPREVIEHALAHQLKDKAEAAYARGSLLDKRRRLMNDWADWCAEGAGKIALLKTA